MAATDSFTPLEQSYLNFDQIRPLEPGRADEHFYVDLGSRSVQELRFDLIREAGRNIKILFSGHQGCGKSTLLNYLAATEEIKNAFLIVKYSIQDLLDPNDLNHIDVLLSMALKAYEAAERANLGVSTKLRERAEQFAKQLHGLIEVEGTSETGRSGNVGTEGGVSVPSWLEWISGKFFARYQLEFETRKKVREHFSPNLSDLISTLNAILREIRLSLPEQRQLLLLIDDTDKMPLAGSLEVFGENGLHLAKPECCVVYVVDMALVCSGRFRAIVKTIGKEVILPNLRLTDVHGQRDQAADRDREVLREVVRSRMVNPEEIEPEALDDAITMSGGVMRELMSLMAKSVRNACLANKKTVTRDDVALAVISTRNEYTLYADHVEILKKVLRDPYWHPETGVEDPRSPFLDLLHTLALLEYRNGEDKWRHPHPVLRKLLERPRVEQP